jgi:predicted TIM-barrel fold metal-dependent hydrolase
MPMPTNIRVIDTMMGLPKVGGESWMGALKDTVKDASGTEKHPAGYMFKDPVTKKRGADPVGDTIREMDKYNIEMALMTVTDEASIEAVTQHRDRFVGGTYLDPNQGMDAVRQLVKHHEQYGVRAAVIFPCGYNPAVPINDKKAYPIYSKCVELNIPLFINAGVPGPRVPYEPQFVGHLDEVCWFFPELKVVMRHGAEPWTDLAVKLMLKWPNLYYSTSAFAPKHFPKDIIDYANTRGADKIIYAGYYPSGLSLERSFAELPSVPFRDHVWPKFLRENAVKVLGL